MHATEQDRIFIIVPEKSQWGGSIKFVNIKRRQNKAPVGVCIYIVQAPVVFSNLKKNDSVSNFSSIANQIKSLHSISLFPRFKGRIVVRGYSYL